MLAALRSDRIDPIRITGECDRIRHESSRTAASIEDLRTLFRSIDLTTLEGTDTDEKVRKLCAKAVRTADRLAVAAVCVHSTFVREAKRALHGSEVRVASVAGAFPSGQSPIHVKLAEVTYAIGEGADELDVVINRGKFLEGDLQFVFDEIVAMKECCGDRTLKVILETGELADPRLIATASDLAIAAGAGFIKTSTGKASIGATLEAVVVMLHAIRDHFSRTGVRIGIKPSGGIRNVADAMQYLIAVRRLLGEEWLDPRYFRIGASSLLDDITLHMDRIGEAQDPADR